MKKRWLFLAVIFGINVGLFAGGSSEASAVKDAEGPSGKLVLYSPANDEEYYMITDAFQLKYPQIQIETVQGGSGELKTRLASEKQNPKADVMFGGLSYADAVTYQDLWDKYVSPNDASLPQSFRNITGYVTLKSINLQVLLVNRNLEKETGITIEGLEDLLNPALKGKIAMPDPGSSATAYRWLTCILYVMGKGNPESKEAWNYIESLIQNLAGKLSSSMSVAHKSVYRGEYVVGFTSESNATAYLADGFADAVKVVYPKEGTSAPSYGAAVIRNCRNPENAKLFIDFLISDEGQKIYANSSFRPANTKYVNTSKWLPDINKIKIVDENYEYISKNQESILNKFNEIWAKYN
ncbi:extracellular solute-binding protein [Treponema parvum]|uniref:extracellular solute-binding protein n=1 Tax=Treponema parvum TaxID=138851 RepID=UPI001AEC6CC8|nr:extracellular solute-binding protein [Treponema parvum]QTQ16464.1 extracellular solute-binding protein [Treponema parvum]